MTQISLNTDDLKNGSYELNTFSAELAKISSAMGSTSAGLDGKYNGQLASQVNRIAAQAQNTGNDRKNRLLELSNFLARKASAFEAVDNENVGSVLGVTNQMSWLESSYPVAASSATINPLYLDKATSIWALGGFYLGKFTDWISKFPPFAWMSPSSEQKSKIELPITTNVNFRDAPNGNIIDPRNPTIIKGSTVYLEDNVEISKDGHTWVQVTTEDGRTGWIAKDVLPLPVVIPGLSGDKTPTPPRSVTPSTNNIPTTPIDSTTIIDTPFGKGVKANPSLLGGNENQTEYFPIYNYSGKLHTGIDLDRTDGQNFPVYPVGPGKVIEVVESNKGYGNYVMIEHKVTNGNKVDTVYSLYAHMEGSPKVKLNQEISSTKTELGISGESGNADGTHLHFEVRKILNAEDFFGKEPTLKVDSNDANSKTLEEKMRDQYYSPNDVLNRTGEAKDWVFLL